MVYTLLAAGHETVADIQDADMVLVNTFGLSRAQRRRAIENILEACSYKEQNPGLKVVVTGCLPSATAARSAPRSPRWTRWWAAPPTR